SEVVEEVGKIPTMSLVIDCENLIHFGEVTGDCSQADVYRLRDSDGQAYAIERVNESIDLGRVDSFVNFEAKYGSGYYSLAFPPDSPLLADFIDELPRNWLVDLPADPQAWAAFEAALAEMNPEYWLHTPDLSPLDDVDNVRTGIRIGTAIAGSIAL